MCVTYFRECAPFSLLPQGTDSDNRPHNYWFLITQAQKIGVLQFVVSDEDACNWNCKWSYPPSVTSSTYFNYFQTLLIPSQELTFPWKPVAELGFHPKFSILIYYSCPFSPIKLGSNKLSFSFRIMLPDPML